MKVSELITLLSKYDSELEVVFEYYSDYSRLSGDEISIVELIDDGDRWVKRYYKNQHPEPPANLKRFVAFPGN